MSGRRPDPWGGRYRPEPSAPHLSQTTGADKAKSPYARGRDFEAAVRGQLERRGYFVLRSYGSKGKIDLLATGQTCVYRSISGLFIQCKRTGDIGSKEWNEVYEIAVAAAGWPVIAFRPTARTTAYYRIDAPRAYRGQGRPWTQFDPTDCSLILPPPRLPLSDGILSSA